MSELRDFGKHSSKNEFNFMLHGMTFMCLNVTSVLNSFQGCLFFVNEIYWRNNKLDNIFHEGCMKNPRILRRSSYLVDKFRVK